MHSIESIFTKEKTDKVQTITTLEIAEMMETPHYEILRKLEGTTNADGSTKQIGIIPVLTDGKIPVSDYFSVSAYKDASGKENRCYNVTKIGCDFLANKFTGEKGILFTARYVKRFDEMENHIKREDRPSLDAVNRAAYILKGAYQAAGTDERYLVLLVGSVYKECGMEFALPPVKMDTDKLYDQTMIANELGIMSTSGKPHAQVVGVIIEMLGISDDYKISTPYINHGHSGIAVQYKVNVVDMVRDWLEDNGYPRTISGENKNYNVCYR